MNLQPGEKLGPYEIQSLLGRGGMGEVYRAHDARLKRDVAIKTSSARFDDRFEREARAIAALNHSNISHIYDIGPDYIVMELIEGSSVKGPLRERDVLRIAEQIAAALAAAHEKGIIHRDLKPDNIRITPAGVVKVLDFGLAKQTHPSDGDLSGTLTGELTQRGIAVGTPAYMAPEQAQGQDVDRRVDIWAFGVVLYELLSGKRLFQTESVRGTLTAVLTQEPDLSKVPVRYHRLLRACLNKDPQQRLSSIADWRLLLDDASVPTAKKPASTKLPWIIAVAALLAVAFLIIKPFWSRAGVPSAGSIPMSVPIPGGNGTAVTFEVSPDGKNIAIAGDQDGVRHLWVRSLNSLNARLIEGTEGAMDPFWSPTSDEIGFSADGKLKRVSLSGQVSTIANEVGVGSWGSHGVILLSLNGYPLRRVDIANGSVAPLLKPEADSSITDAHFLPDGEHYVYLHYLGPAPGIYFASLDGSVRKRVLPVPTKPLFVPLAPGSNEGFLLYRQSGVLMAQRFDAKAGTLSGSAIPIAEPVTSRDGWGPTALFSASNTGVLAYETTPMEQLVWMNRSGSVAGAFGVPGEFQNFRLSPDETKVASRIDRFTDARSSADVGIHDMLTGALERMTFDGGPDFVPVWGPNNKLVFTSQRLGTFDPFITDGPGKEKLLYDMPERSGFPLDWSRDGRFVLWQGFAGPTRGTLWIIPLDTGQKPYLFIESMFDTKLGAFSPDGKWIAYCSNESGTDELYVKSFEGSTRYTVSAGGGLAPAWRSDGKELFFQNHDGKLNVVSATAQNSALSFSKPQQLFAVPQASFYRRYEPSKDGQRILIPTGAAAITVILNWPELLRR